VQFSYSQFLNGYPTAGITKTVNSSDIYFMDDTRAHVNRITAMGPTADNLSIDHIGIPFTIGDRIMIIQMITAAGATTGYFEERQITNITNSGHDLLITKMSRTYTTSIMLASARVQVLKIPRFILLTNKGVIRCRPWNGYTGGVLCFAAESVLMGGGVFDASATGFGPDNVNWAIKGTPGVGETSYNAGGGMYLGDIMQSPCINPEPNSINRFLVNLGVEGDVVPVSSYPGVGTASSYSSGTAYNYGHPSFTAHKVVMGSAGYFPSGHNAGAQGQGGAHGGSGGSTNAPTPISGASGLPGGNATSGGDAGKGAIGGGIILMKTGKMENIPGTPISTTSYDFLLAAGANGDNGKSGGAGGLSGKGGDGGMDSQVGLDIYYSGGNGGHGDYGKAGNGGDGSNGATAGTIFLYNRDAVTWNCFGTKPPPKVGSVNLTSGKGGVAGPKGYTREPSDNSVTILPSNLTTPYTACIPSGGTIDKDICQCDIAMTPFRSVVQNSSGTAATVVGNTYVWTYYSDLDLNYGIITYDKTTGEVKTISHVGGNTNTYHCKYFDLDNANYIFTRISYHVHNMTQNHVVLPANKISTGGNNFEIRFDDDQSLFNVKYVRDNNQRYMYYEHSPNKVMADTTACNPNNKANPWGYHDSQGTDGNLNGTQPYDVPFGLGDPTSHFGFSTNELFRQETNNRKDAYKISNLTDNNFMILEDKETVLEETIMGKLNSELIDLTGKTIWVGYIFPSEIFKISNIAKGVYILNINNQLRKKISIN